MPSRAPRSQPREPAGLELREAPGRSRRCADPGCRARRAGSRARRARPVPDVEQQVRRSCAARGRRRRARTACPPSPATGSGAASMQVAAQPVRRDHGLRVPRRVELAQAVTGRLARGDEPVGLVERRPVLAREEQALRQRRLVRPGDRHQVVDGEHGRQRDARDEVLRAVHDLRAGPLELGVRSRTAPRARSRAGPRSGTMSMRVEVLAGQPLHERPRRRRVRQRSGGRRRAVRAPRRARSCSARSRPGDRPCRRGRRRAAARSRHRPRLVHVAHRSLSRSDAHPDGLQPLASGGRRWRRAVRVRPRGAPARRGPRGRRAHPRGRRARTSCGTVDAVAVPDPGRRRPSRPGAGCSSTRSTSTTRAPARRSTRCSTTLRPDVVHTHAVQGLSSVALTRPSRHGVAHVHTLHDYWLLCQRNSMVHRDGRACETRCRSCVAISWIRNESVRRSPPGVVLAVSQAIAARARAARLDRAARCGCSTTRSRSSPGARAVPAATAAR